MTPQAFLNEKVTLWRGDCREVLQGLEPDSFDACVTDPPYHLHSIVKRFAKTGRTDKTRTTSGPHQRAVSGFMNKQWDGGDVAFRPETWAEALRVMKPGAYLLAFSSSRTFGRMSVAIEDAGFITHPFIAYIFGSGFPKAHNAAKAIDRELGSAGGIDPTGDAVRRIRPGADQNKDGSWEKLEDRAYQPGSYKPATDEAAAWNGWAYGGQCLKPAIEPIYMGQKPFAEHNGAANILRHGTGAINIDGCRVPHVTVNGGNLAQNTHLRSAVRGQADSWFKQGDGERITEPSSLGRWPANVVHDGSDEVLAAFPEAPGQQQDIDPLAPSPKTGSIYGKMSRDGEASAGRRYTEQGGTNFAALPGQRRGDSGSAARFFYTAKADADGRAGSKHPTIKPLDLLRYLARLVTPTGGLILDPFAGSGTLGEAAYYEGFRAVLIEREQEYCEDIARRMALVLTGPDERAREILKARGKVEAYPGPLFERGAA